METVMSQDPYEVAFILAKCHDAQVVNGQYVGVGAYRLTLTVAGHGVSNAQEEWRLGRTDHARFANDLKHWTLIAFRVLKEYKQKERQENSNGNQEGT